MQIVLRLAPLHAAPEAPQLDGAAVTHTVPLAGDLPRLAGAPGPLARWSTAVAGAHDPCLVVDPEGLLVSLSVPAADLLGCTGAGVIGRSLLDVVRLVDFETGDPFPEYSRRIPSLGVLASRGLMRGLMRVHHPDGRRLTLDAVAAPIHDAGSAVIGSVTYLSLITPA